jgi:hypothetical protein
MINRSLRWMLVALGPSAFHPICASAQGEVSAPLPAGVTACEFRALARQADLDEPSVRSAPGSDGRVLGLAMVAARPAAAGMTVE